MAEWIFGELYAKDIPAMNRLPLLGRSQTLRSISSLPARCYTFGNLESAYEAEQSCAKLLVTYYRGVFDRLDQFLRENCQLRNHSRRELRIEGLSIGGRRSSTRWKTEGWFRPEVAEVHRNSWSSIESDLARAALSGGFPLKNRFFLIRIYASE